MRLALLALIPFAAGCGGQDCTLIGCANSFEIAFNSSALLPDGTYDLTLEFGGQQARCSVTLMEGSTTEECSDPRIWKVGALIFGIATANRPETVKVTLARDGVELVDERVELDFDTVYPNGKECDLGCGNARVAFAL